ncbi:MAG: carboxypeptidase regulatory-like domain-containing protein [Deltaproteobacteria bacterium]|nr:carboxypeptidase regulatory-like domain-containing protein [Deltaproteobacteria bacterium]
MVKFLITFSICLTLSTWSAHIEAADTIKTPDDVAADGLPGFFNLGIPFGGSSRLSLAGTARYGVIESIGPINGLHHELGGNVALGGVFAKWFAAGLQLDGKFQNHPNQSEEEVDHSMVGIPILKLRAGAPAGNHLLLGGELEIHIPGGNAPSLQFNAATLTGRFLGTVVSAAPFFLGVTAGFRIDNSENSAPAQETLRPGDRIALDIAAYHSFLLGIAMSYEINRLRFIFETDARFYASSDAAISESPIRLTLGARYVMTAALQFDLYTETFLSKRPDVDIDAPLLPIPPRFAAMFGIRYTWGAEAELKPEPPKEELVISPALPEAPPETRQKSTGGIQGRITDEEGLPVAAASIRVLAADGSAYSATSDSEGNYSVAGVPTGSATVTASAEYFEPKSFDVTVSENAIATVASAQLVQTKVGSQIRGLVRDTDGTPLDASIVIKPGRYTTQTDDKGFFEIDVDPGEYTVEISSEGLVKQKRAVTVGDNSVVILNVDLAAKQ